MNAIIHVMPLSDHSEITQIIQDFARDLGDNIDIEDYLPFLVHLLKEIELDSVHGHKDKISAFRRVLNDLGGEIQERLNSGEWTEN